MFCDLYLSPGRLEALGPHRLVGQVEAELEDVGLREDLLVGVQGVATKLYRCFLLASSPGPHPQRGGGTASLLKEEMVKEFQTKLFWTKC